MVDVNEALNEAIQQNKLLLLVLGAQWCHDSRGLASRFSNEKLFDVIENKYHTVFIDVGYLQDRRDITQRFGYPSYFATPTVMVIEPKSEQLLNGESMDIWAFAASISLEDYLDYFSDERFQLDSNVELKKETFNAINAFASKQTEKLTRAYAKISPMLAQSDAGEAPDEFASLWKEVRRFRLALQKDIIKLTKEASETGTDSHLVFPEYAPFSWEQATVSE
nr:thioredoxin family protein [Alteromonas sp. 5E99-2]